MVEDPPYLKRAKTGGVRIDYIGIALLALGVGALQVLLDKGQEDDWFGSRFIVTLMLISAVCLISLVIWEWFDKAPIIDVRLFKSFNFAVGNMMMFVLGVLLFSSLVMMPLFLQTLLGYTAQSAGLVLSGSGVILLIEMPIVGQLTSKFPGQVHHRLRLAGAVLGDVLLDADGWTCPSISDRPHGCGWRRAPVLDSSSCRLRWLVISESRRKRAIASRAS